MPRVKNLTKVFESKEPGGARDPGSGDGSDGKVGKLKVKFDNPESSSVQINNEEALGGKKLSSEKVPKPVAEPSKCCTLTPEVPPPGSTEKPASEAEKPHTGENNPDSCRGESTQNDAKCAADSVEYPAARENTDKFRNDGTSVTAEESDSLPPLGSGVERVRKRKRTRPTFTARRSFTTEDLDLFQRKSTERCLEGSDDDSCLQTRRKSAEEIGDETCMEVSKITEKSRRRSRSLSSITNLKISLPTKPTKPKVPSKPNLLLQISSAVTKTVTKTTSKSTPSTPTSLSVNALTSDTDQGLVASIVAKQQSGKHHDQVSLPPQTSIDDVNVNGAQCKYKSAKDTKKPNKITSFFSKRSKSEKKLDLKTKTVEIDIGSSENLKISEKTLNKEDSGRTRNGSWVLKKISQFEGTGKNASRSKSDSSEVSDGTDSKSRFPEYENIPTGAEIYPNIEVIKGRAGRKDLAGTDIYDNNVAQITRRTSSENPYEDFEFSGNGHSGNDTVTDPGSEVKDTNPSGYNTDDDVFSSEWDSDIEFADDSLSEVGDEEKASENQVIESSDPMTKVKHIANEILTTERAYVRRLHLVDQVFHFRILIENRLHSMFPDTVIPEMFSNIKSIYQFHHDFLLPQLEKRMNLWDTTPKIGDLMKQFAPFLKLYTEYVKNFDHSRNVIMNWTNKSQHFGNLITELQNLPECGQLTLQHHMLEPIQRVPRYQLLLKDYKKHLSEDSPDLPDTEKALELVTTAARHSNEVMQKMEQFGKLLELNEKFGGSIDLISPTRELIKEGRITKISARNGDHMDRQIFLFSDMVLLASAMSIGLKTNFKLRTKLEMDGMQILEGDNLETPNTFYVKSKQKTIELHTSNSEEKMEWLVALSETVEEYTKRKLSRLGAGLTSFPLEEEEVGMRAPTWIKDQDTSMCMRCTVTFTTLRRRHHCRACGIVVCNNCSQKKARMPYNDMKPARVCDKCYDLLESDNSSGAQTSSPWSPKRRGVLKVKAADPSLISGYLHLCSGEGHSWTKRWFAVHSDFVLYSFKAHQDIAALTSMPLPGMKVLPCTEDESMERENVFKIFHHSMKKKNGYFLQAEDRATMDRWISVLEKVVMAEMPDDLLNA